MAGLGECFEIKSTNKIKYLISRLNMIFFVSICDFFQKVPIKKLLFVGLSPGVIWAKATSLPKEL
jgi:hypothetical protein